MAKDGSAGRRQSAPQEGLGAQRMALEFGIFDHVDRNDPLAQFYDDRPWVEAYDRAGITAIIAPAPFDMLGMSPSPGVYLAAIAARTKRLRFGPLVYTLALYHPLRLAEEICMLDQISRGRLMVGVGKGISHIETGYYGVDWSKADKIFAEAMNVIRQALTQKTVDFEGEFFRYKNVPMELSPYQQPHPPLWYGVITPDSAERAARAGMNIVGNSPAKVFRAIADRYRASQALPGGAAPTRPQPLHVSVTRNQAVEVARRAYRRWWASFMALWNKHGIPPNNVSYPPEIDGQIADNRAIVGTPAKALELLRQEIAESGANYLVCRFAYGDMTLAESMRSLDLFQRHVMPALRESVPVAAE
jgi:alkanesulfonate monooxygenase SsuD/methylene tetrahydromethanopterin reductase-like flavin-dependent oxidoreductase (luciferase family)